MYFPNTLYLYPHVPNSRCFSLYRNSPLTPPIPKSFLRRAETIAMWQKWFLYVPIRDSFTSCFIDHQKDYSATDLAYQAHTHLAYIGVWLSLSSNNFPQRHLIPGFLSSCTALPCITRCKVSGPYFRSSELVQLETERRTEDSNSREDICPLQ